jgi:hypothetical protein
MPEESIAKTSDEKILSNLDRYKRDLNSLILMGDRLLLSIQNECFPNKIKEILGGRENEELGALLKALPDFKENYQSWYSEAKALIKQMLPDRLIDFVRYYEKPKLRKEITYESYRIEDYLQGLHVTRGYEEEKVVGPDAAIPHFQQQVAIVKAVKVRFESSLFDIRQLVQADLFDSELEASKELAGKKFTRAAGALAGVVLERHLAQVCENHNIKVTKKNPTIVDFNDHLKDGNVVGIPDWRFIQHLGDIRNLCDHSKAVEPTIAQVDELIAGVARVTKTLF